MKILSDKYPIDIILVISYSVIMALLTLFNFKGILFIILGLPLILFIPGYVLIFMLFPTKIKEEGIGLIQRIALSIGFSLAIIALIGVALNFTAGGIQMRSAFLSIFIFILVAGLVGIYRWFSTPYDERFVISFDLSLPKSEQKIDKIITIILVFSIIVAIITLIYVIATPKNMENSTEFYIISPSGKAGNYIRNVNAGENASLIIGLINHEYQTINYTIEIWLINQTNYYNNITMENETVVFNMWFQDKINVMLEHVDAKGLWEPQWEYNYTFSIKEKGEDLKLAFLLFKTPNKDYDNNKDYKDIYEQKISSAYAENYLWINVN